MRCKISFLSLAAFFFTSASYNPMFKATTVTHSSVVSSGESDRQDKPADYLGYV